MSGNALARSFGNVAALYDRFRLDYSQASLDRAQEALELGPDASVIDLAAGTGRLTRELIKRFAQVIAVEPDDAMRSLIADGKAVAGSAESIPVPDGSADAVFVGEAFHWFDAPVAVREMARVLRPRGGVALISNLWWETEPPLPQTALDLLRVPYERSGRSPSPLDKGDSALAAFDDSPFEPLRREVFTDGTTLDADTLLALYSTTSSIAAMPENERGELVASVRPLLAGPYRLPVRVELTWTRLA